MKPKSIPLLILPIAFALSGCTYDLSEIEPTREVTCFESAKVSLYEAVEAAEIEGGSAIDAAYRQVKEMGCLEGNPGYYDVTVLIGGKLSLVSVDAKSEQIQPRLEQGIVRDLSGQFFERLAEGSSTGRIAIAERLNFHLHEAIAIAEKNGGKAMEARVEARAGTPGYTVKLVDRGRLRVTWVAEANHSS